MKLLKFFKKRAAAVKLLSASLLSICLGVNCGSGAQSDKTAEKFDTEDRFSRMNYVIGRSIGTDLKHSQDSVRLPLDLDIVFMAIREAVEDAPARLSDSVMLAVDNETKQVVREIRQRHRIEFLRGNLAAARAFLLENAKKEGVTVTNSGLQYLIINEGAAGQRKPSATDRVRWHSRGSTSGGTVFEDTFASGSPITAAVDGLIAGLSEALQLMPVGARYRFFLPPELAYGNRGSSSLGIVPNTALVFEVELLGIE